MVPRASRPDPKWLSRGFLLLSGVRRGSCARLHQLARKTQVKVVLESGILTG